jgi:hypothetical protein
MHHSMNAVRAGLILVALGLSACGGRFSTQEAVERCDIERANKLTVTDEVYDACVACFEDCGEDCAAAGSTPETYRCPE